MILRIWRLITLLLTALVMGTTFCSVLVETSAFQRPGVGTLIETTVRRTTPSDVGAAVRAPTVSVALHAAYLGGGWAMIHTVVSKEIDAPPERVAALYADYEGWPQLFAATIRGVRLLADDGQRKTIEIDHATEGKVINIMIAVSPREIQLEEFKQRFDARFTNRFEAAGQRTRYSIVADVQLKGAARVLGPLVTPIVRARLNRFVLEPMRAAVEGYGEGRKP